MMKFSLLFACVFCCTCSLQAQWERVLDANGGQVNTLNRTPDGRLWAGTGTGLFHSNDEGDTWTRNTAIAPTWNVEASNYINGKLYLLAAQSMGNNSARMILTEIAANGSSYSKVVGTSQYTQWTHTAVFSANNYLFAQAENMLLRSPSGSTNLWTTLQTAGFTLQSIAGDGNVIAAVSTSSLPSTPSRAFLSFNGGTNWQLATLPGASTTENVSAVFVRGTRVLVSYANGDLFVSNDQGSSWVKVKMPFSINYNTVSFRWDEVADALRMHTSGQFFASPDGGLTWQSAGFISGNEIQDFLPEDQRLYAGGKTGFARRDNPAGPFIRYNTGLRAAPTRFIKTFGNETFAVFSTGLSRSSDGGTTWTPVDISLLSAPDFYEIRDFEKDGNRLYLLTNKGLLMSEDNGATWPATYTTTDTGTSLQFGAAGELWIIGWTDLVTVVSRIDPTQVIRTFSYLLTPGTNDYLYVLHYNEWDGNILGYLPENGNIYASANKGKDWTIRANLPGTQNLAGRFYQASGAAGRLFFLSSNAIFYSGDHGFTWTKASGVPNSIGAVTEVVEAGGSFYATTHFKGILRSNNNGSNWQLVSNNATDIHLEGIGATTVNGEARLLVGSENRGVWRYNPAMNNSPFKLVSGKTTLCPGAIMNYCLAELPLGSKYSWLVPPISGINGWLDNPLILDAPDGHCADVYFPINSPTTNTISVTYDGDGWPVPVTVGFLIYIQPILTNLPSITVAFEDLPFNSPLTGDAVPLSPGTYNFSTTLTSYLGCDSVVRQNVIVKAPTNGTVLGTVFWDNNNNGVFNANGDLWASGIVVRSSSGLFTNTDASGKYSLQGLVSGDTIWAVATVPNTVVLPAFSIYQAGNATANFRFFKASPSPDLTVDLTLQNVIRSGFDTKITITCRNNGLQTAQNVQLKFYVPNLLTIKGTMPASSNQIGDTLIWDLGTVPFNETRTVMVTVNTPVNLPLNTPIVFSAIVLPTSGDNNPLNNTTRISTWVRNSYDPNDKQVSPEYVTPAMLANKEQFSYTIRFQNTGNFPADFVRISDTLGQLVDPSTLRLIASSHPCTWKIKGKGVVEFFFDDIQLPDSSSNEPGSHGFVKFSVQPRPGLSLGTVVKNTADIYFDFNPAIRTNTAGTQVVYFIPGQPPAGDELALRPNPAAFRAFCSWKNPLQESGTIRLYDLNGLPRREMSVGTGSTEASFDVQGLPSGAYLAVLEAGPVFLVKTLTVVNLGWMGLGGQ